MAAVNMTGSYNYALVALSVLIATFASYAALDLAGRVTAATGWTRSIWLLGGAVAMGTGIWSMHYIGMLAFILPIPVAYHWPTVLLSLFAAILASFIALYVVSQQEMDASRALAGSVLMGAGISSMHYIGMAAMRLRAVCQFNSFLVGLSVVFAVLISLAALWITFHFRDEKRRIGWERLAGAVVMGGAIPVMHYTGMAAASFMPSSTPMDLSYAVSISTLGTAGIATVTFIVLGLALLTSWIDRRLAAETLELQEGKLQRNEAFLAQAQSISHSGSFGWRPSTGEFLWSEETFRIFQYDGATKPTLELALQRVHPEDATLVKQTMERAWRDGKDFDHEYRLVMPDGSVKHVHVVGQAARDKSGGLEFIGAVMDLTLAKHAEEKIRQTERELRQLIDAIPQQVFVYDSGWSPLFANRRDLDFTGLSPQEVQSKDVVARIFHPEDLKKVEAIRERARSEGSPFEIEARIRGKGGEFRWFLIRYNPLLDEQGRVLRWYGTRTDIEDRKQAEETLRQAQADLTRANRMSSLGELTASLAHEVKQPIAATITNAGTCLRWLCRDEPDLEKARAAVSRIEQDGKRASEIVNHVRLLFQKDTLERELVDLNEIIREMLLLLHSEATEFAVSIQTELAADLPQVMGDRVQLQQVLMNLMMNSIDAMKDMDGRRELTIKSQRGENGEVLISVSDTGVGLPPQQADKIFDAFFTTKTHGTGMGLRISRSIVESHGGRLWVADNSPRGATLQFTLPAKVAAHA
ncbi:MAG TPA: MHYT domain-containing protein [Candidatus Sulfotelmatobacter sp.]|nr:MHYT domain-containing protein [Candidatus Sulfotelmatobacter sp.]